MEIQGLNPMEAGAEIFAAELIYREKDFRFDLRQMRVRPSDARGHRTRSGANISGEFLAGIGRGG